MPVCSGRYIKDEMGTEIEKFSLFPPLVCAVTWFRPTGPGLEVPLCAAVDVHAEWPGIQHTPIVVPLSPNLSLNPWTPVRHGFQRT